MIDGRKQWLHEVAWYSFKAASAADNVQQGNDTLWWHGQIIGLKSEYISHYNGLHFER